MSIETDYRILLRVHKDALADAGLLEKYIAERGDRFDEYGYDHILLLQAQSLGLLDFASKKKKGTA